MVADGCWRLTASRAFLNQTHITTVSPIHHICIPSEAFSSGLSELCQHLGNGLLAKFNFSNDYLETFAGKLLFEGSNKGESDALLCAQPGITTLTVSSVTTNASSEELSTIAVKFADNPEVPFPFRGRSLSTKVVAMPRKLDAAHDEKVLAETHEGPIWVMSLRNDVKHYRTSMVLPVIPDGGILRDVLQGDRFLELLPLIHWLRGICNDARYEGPALRACFMFDDPNLHWPSYGHVDFREVALGAAKENYHVSFATVPLDNWFTHQPTAKLFRKHARHISLLVHGNNHTHQELAQNYAPAESNFLLRQAIGRIEKLERVAGVEVSRVMAAPHGACSENMLEQLPKRGFESATISHGSLRAHNKGKAWTRSLGFAPSEWIHDCPVLPRWRLAAGAQNTILLAAYLHQAIILVGHHGDLKDGIGLMDQLAGFINGLGPVQWLNMADLSRANYRSWTEGGIMRLQPFGRRLLIKIPEGVTQLAVEAVGGQSSGKWRVSNMDGSVIQSGDGDVICLPPGIREQLVWEKVSDIPSAADQISTRPALGALARRLATECRDRVKALVGQ